MAYENSHRSVQNFVQFPNIDQTVDFIFYCPTVCRGGHQHSPGSRKVVTVKSLVKAKDWKR